MPYSAGLTNERGLLQSYALSVRFLQTKHMSYQEFFLSKNKAGKPVA